MVAGVDFKNKCPGNDISLRITDWVSAMEPRRHPALRPSRQASFGVTAVLVLCAGVTAIHLPVLTSEPIFSLVNICTSTTLGALAVYMAIAEREMFTGVAFGVAALDYPLVSLDIYPGWGAFASWTLGFGAAFYTPLVWGMLRYGRKRLYSREEALFLLYGAVITQSPGLTALALARPEWLGMAPDVEWLTIWPNHNAAVAALTLNVVGATIGAAWFSRLIVSKMKRMPPVPRTHFRPVAVFGCIYITCLALINVPAVLFPRMLQYHTYVAAIGALTLGTAVSMLVMIVRRRLFGLALLSRIPYERTTHSLTNYVKTYLQDPSAELIFSFPDVEALIDRHGKRYSLDSGLETPGRYHTWIDDEQGQRIVLLIGDVEAAPDRASLIALKYALSIVAENVRLNAAISMQVAQLSAARAAESLAFERAMEEFRRNLHDGVQQTIAAARLDADGLRDTANGPAQGQLVATLEGKLTIALDQIRHLKRGSTPPELRFGLKAAVERCAAELRLHADVHMTSGSVGPLTLPIYYIIREAITNVHKHACTDRVEVMIRNDEREIQVTIFDSGAGGARLGSDTATTGLNGMRHRARELGGDLKIHSPVGVGTTVNLWLPCVLQ